MRLCWITDPHLNFMPPEPSMKFATEPWYDAIVITGDIAEAPSLVMLLKKYAESVKCPVYFVLGNHDYYRGSFKSVREQAAAVGAMVPNLTWLDAAKPILLDDELALVGNEGWYDGMFGNPLTKLFMSDFVLIDELRAVVDRSEWMRPDASLALLKVIRKRSRASASAAKAKLLEALKVRKKVVFATHYPPFEGACWYDGKLSDSNWMPWFTSAAMGVMLAAVAADHPEHQILVLCGHTHGEGAYQHAPNLRVLTGKAAYGVPMVAGLVTAASFDGWGGQ